MGVSLRVGACLCWTSPDQPIKDWPPDQHHEHLSSPLVVLKLVPPNEHPDHSPVSPLPVTDNTRLMLMMNMRCNCNSQNSELKMLHGAQPERGLLFHSGHGGEVR